MSLGGKILWWTVGGAIAKPGLRRNLVIAEITRRIREANMGSWKTTLCGGLAALGTFLSTVKEPGWVEGVGKIMVAVGTMGVGVYARDNNVSSEQAGIK